MNQSPSLLGLDGDVAATGRLSVRAINWLLPGVICLLVVAGTMRFDVPLEIALVQHPFRGAFRELLEVVEVFGNGWGVLLLLLAVALLDITARPRLLRLACASLGAGVVADAIKLCVARQRPRSLVLEATQFWDTFTAWFPWTSAGTGGQSFPSAHSASAAGLAFALAVLYPQGRWLFASLAIGVGLQRLVSRAHFPSDVLVGLLLGSCWAWQVMLSGPICRWFHLLESARMGCERRWPKRAR